jgi:anti-sigma regulatory factor (Ser/Thr protein kinase)
MPAAAAPCPSDDLVNLRLAGGPDAAALARRAVARLEGDLDIDTLDVVRLLVTELVTNSVRHAEADAVDIRVHVASDQVRLEVTDRGPGFEFEERGRNQDLEGGWGLYLVDRLADRWGIAYDGGASRVWAEIDRTD